MSIADMHVALDLLNIMLESSPDDPELKTEKAMIERQIWLWS